MTNPLKRFSDEDLLEELSRRQRLRVERDERLEFKPCDSCANFKPWRDAETMPEGYNPCVKGHKMSFRLFESSPYESDWGHYRRVCGDRTAMSANPTSEQP